MYNSKDTAIYNTHTKKKRGMYSSITRTPQNTCNVLLTTKNLVVDSQQCDYTLNILML